MATPLDGIRAKLDRADKHLNVLDDLIGSYFAENPYRIIGEEKMEGEYWHYATYLEVDRFPPDEVWGPIIGDAVHNLRSALDHLAWALALPEARATTPRRIEFPIFLDDPTENPEIRGAFTKKLHCLRPEAQTVVDGAQPYKTGDSHHPLWLLQALWNTDKHRTLHTTGFAYALAANLSGTAEWGYNGWSWGPFGDRFDSENRTPLESGYALASALASADPFQERMDTYKGVTFDVTLGHREAVPDRDAEPYGGLPIRQALRRLQRYVAEEVVEPLQPLL
jgi:hypothetical protein